MDFFIVAIISATLDCNKEEAARSIWAGLSLCAASITITALPCTHLVARRISIPVLSPGISLDLGEYKLGFYADFYSARGYF